MTAPGTRKAHLAVFMRTDNRTIQPDFDPRPFGHTRSSDLADAIGLLKVDRRPGGFIANSRMESR